MRVSGTSQRHKLLYSILYFNLGHEASSGLLIVSPSITTSCFLLGFNSVCVCVLQSGLKKLREHALMELMVVSVASNTEHKFNI